MCSILTSAVCGESFMFLYFSLVTSCSLSCTAVFWGLGASDTLSKIQICTEKCLCIGSTLLLQNLMSCSAVYTVTVRDPHKSI